MIKFIGKFTRQGEIVAWKISDEGVEYNIAYRAVYHEFYFQNMIDSGYKFHDYDCNITTPDGFPLKDIVESTDYLSDSELIDLRDSIEVGMLDEKDIVQYFDRNVDIEYIEVKDPIREDLKTREDLNNYLDTLTLARERGIFKFLPRPVNAFTNKDALFTIEEILSNKDEAKTRFIKMFNNHTMMYKSSLENLNNIYGIQDTDSSIEKMLKLIKGFFAWGIPGIKANITSIRFEANPTTSIRNISKSLDQDVILKYGVRCKYDGKFYSEDCLGRDFYSLAHDPEVDTHAIYCGEELNSKPGIDIHEDYSIVSYGYKKANPRVYIDLLSDDGISATFIADCDEAHLYKGTEEMLVKLNMFNYKTMDDVYIPYSRLVINGTGYIGDSVLIRAYIKEQVKKSTIVPKYDTSFKLLTGIGVSPYYAPMYINKLIADGAPQYVEIDNVSNFINLHYYCSDTFREGFSDKIIEKYGTGDEDFYNKPLLEQLEYINEEISNLQSRGEYLVKPIVPEGESNLFNVEYNNWKEEYGENEVGNVNFVYSLLNGTQNIGNLAIGMKADNNFNDSKIFYAIYSALLIERMNNPELQCNTFLNNGIEKYLDTSLAFKERKATAMGCLKDIAIYRSEMAKSASNLIYVTKIFRENGNETFNTINRHYGFECIVYGKSTGSKGAEIYKSLYDQLFNELAKSNLIDHSYIIGDSVALILMKLAYENEDINPINGICYIPFSTKLLDGTEFKTSVKLGETYYNLLRSGSLFVKRYSSNYDFCENQFSKANIKCDTYAVNASINPWIVVPREGFTITEYNLFINYFKASELATSFPKSVVDRILSCGGKANGIDCLRELFLSNELYPVMGFEFDKQKEYKLACEGEFLKYLEHEDVENYITRTTNDIKEGKSVQRAVKNTILKSDIQYSRFKPYVYFDGVGTEQTYYDEYSEQISNKYVSNMMPRVLTHDWLENIESMNVLTDSNNISMERIKFEDIPYEYKEFNSKLLYGDFDNTVNVYITKGKLVYGENKYKELSKITIEDLDELSAIKIAIPVSSSDYIIKTINGLVKVGV